MLPIEEFREAVTTAKRRVMIVVIATIVVLVGVMAVIAAFRDAIGDALSRPFGHTTAEGLLKLSPAVVFAVVVGGFWLADQHGKDDSRLKCPSCGLRLDIMSHLVIATRNCPHRGKRVLAEPGTPNL